MDDDFDASTPEVDPSPPRESPVWPLAIAGGVALLLGLVFFGWHVLEQGWVTASHKLLLGGAASVLLTAAAWPLARRGQPEVAGAVGGAGLGAWFSTWIVARHLYGFISAGASFVALVLAVVVCLALADRLRLRLMAALAAVAACATPALTSTGNGQLAELLLYQLGVLGAFAALDVRRNWPELPTLGLLGTWALLMGWGAGNLDATSSLAFVGSAGVLVVAGAASTWRILLQAVSTHDQRQAVARVLIGGLAAWATAAWAFSHHLPSMALTTLALAAWHLAFAVVIARRSDPLHRVTLALGWLMACVGGVLLGGMPAMLGWWTMAAVAIGLVWSGRARYLALVVPPATCAGIYALAFAGERWSLGAGMASAVLLIGGGLWPGRGAHPRGGLVFLGIGLHVAIVTFAGPEAIDARFMLGLVSVAPVIVRGAWTPDRGFALAAQVLAAALAATALLFGGEPAAGPELGGIVALAGAGAVLLVRAPARSRLFDLTGLVTAAFAALGSLGVLSMAMPVGGSAVTTVVLAAVGLGLVVAGLRLHRKLWRHVGLSTVVLGAAKLALVDTAHAALAVRGASFVAVGAILILGAYAYRRAATRDEGLAC